MKYLLLSAFTLMLASGSAQAFEPSSQAALAKSAKAYQAGLNADIRPATEATQPSQVEPATVEPAAGAEPESAVPEDDRDTTRELQQHIKLPRKN